MGFRTDGATLPGGDFVNGTVAPVTVDLSSGGVVAGFSFNPPDSAEIAAGSSSNVLVVSTDATGFTQGSASIIDGGTDTVAAFQPAAASPVPEPNSVALALLAIGSVGVLAFRRRRNAAASQAE